MSEIDSSVVNDDEIARLGRLGVRWDNWTMSSDSVRALDVYSAMASGGRYAFAELRHEVDQHGVDGLSPEWLARLARVVAVRPTDEGDLVRWAHDVLHATVPKLPRDDVTLPLRALHFETLFVDGRAAEARRILDADPGLQELYHGYMDADLLNPLRGLNSDLGAWQAAFNRPQAAAGLWPITADLGVDVPFNTLRAEPQPTADRSSAAEREGDGRDPLVTVIVTTYAPDPEELRHAVRSVLRQTWTQLEVLLIDDASPDRDDELLDSLATEDDRIRVIRLEKNGGTYRARNIGILEARGHLVTGQDTDDWSHPQRIERQVRALKDNPGARGVVAWAERISDDLVRTHVGFKPERRCEITYMYHRQDAIDAGGYLPVRKAGDSEFRHRMELGAGAPVIELEEPLYAIRPSAGSLSRADFRLGWTAPHRRAFHAAYRHWHTTSPTVPALTVDSNVAELPFPVPSRLSGAPDAGDAEVCFVADLRIGGPEERAVVDEIRALADSGRRVAFLQLNSPYTAAGGRAPLIPDVQSLITSGRVQQVLPDDDLYVGTVIVREFGGLEFGREAPLALRACAAVVVLGPEDARTVSKDGTRLIRRLHDAVDRLWGVPVRWAVQEHVGDGQLRSSLARNKSVELIEEPYARIAPSSSGLMQRRGGGQSFTVGTDADNTTADWPPAERLPHVFPMDDPDVDVRVLGDGRGALRVVRRRQLPSTWIDMRRQMRGDVFWTSVDVAVFEASEPRSGSQTQSIMEAVMAGVPVMCSAPYAEFFGEAVTVLDTGDPVAHMRRAASSDQWTTERADAARHAMERRFSSERFLDRLRTMILTNDTPSGADHV
ncbi:glycosyltransferase [Micrococcus luteus]|uniref:glycosyltransferase n=1 Tax=Micrococcus luteus TaxID=1270 RepID=UPI0037C54FA2